LVDEKILGMEDRQGVLGSHSMVSNRIEIATDQQGLLRFVSTCSHEVQHFKFDVRDKKRSDPLTTPEEHRRMPDYFLPWNWNRQCVSLADNRVLGVF